MVQLGEVDRNRILSGTLPVIGFSLFIDGLPRTFSLLNNFSYFTLYMYNIFHSTNLSAIEDTNI